MTKVTQTLISKIYQDPKYSGKHIIIIGGKIHAKKTCVAKSQLLKQLIKKYPKETPIVADIPTKDALVFPELLGRQECLNDFAVLFSGFVTTFSAT